MYCRSYVSINRVGDVISVSCQYKRRKQGQKRSRSSDLWESIYSVVTRLKKRDHSHGQISLKSCKQTLQTKLLCSWPNASGNLFIVSSVGKKLQSRLCRRVTRAPSMGLFGRDWRCVVVFTVVWLISIFVSGCSSVLQFVSFRYVGSFDGLPAIIHRCLIVAVMGDRRGVGNIRSITEHKSRYFVFTQRNFI